MRPPTNQGMLASTILPFGLTISIVDPISESSPSFEGSTHAGSRKTWLSEVRALVQLDLCSAHRRWLAGHRSLLYARARGPRSRRHQGVVLRDASLGRNHRLHALLHRRRT